MHPTLIIVLCLSLCVAAAVAGAAEWKPVEGQMLSLWADQVDPAKPLPEHPRPQMQRAAWVNLNGLWDYAIRPKDESRPQKFDGKILVPFAVESALSGVKKPVTPEQRLWYRRTFQAPALSDGGRLLLHFGAVDWHATVFVNGREVGQHKGGYDPFTFDVTDHLKQGENELTVSVWDPTDTAAQPRGKQTLNPRGIWYTAVTGIWQTVWLEAVPKTHVTGLRIEPDVDASKVRVTIDAAGGGGEVSIELIDAGRAVATAKGKPGAPIELAVKDARLWSPDDPHLYDLRIALNGEGSRDELTSYVGLRKIHFAKADDGFNRLFLNNQPLFQFGPLDQGWWPDGLYTAPTDEALKFDVEVTRRMGFNTARKHVKVEPARWYYWADKLGLLVWQDMPSPMRQADGGPHHVRRNQPDDIEFTPEEASIFRTELKAMIDALRNVPSIVVWVPFNEGWGQHDTNNVLRWTKEYDPTRVIGGPSGWEDRGYGDLKDLHHYPTPMMFPPVEDRVSVLGEFGGLGLPMEEHLWWNKRNWGYRTLTSPEELQRNYTWLIRQLRPLIGRGLAAAIYTQTTDVEGEVNGLMTYDRKVMKIEPETLRQIHRPLYEKPVKMKSVPLVPTSESEPQSWRYTLDQPADDWNKPEFSDSGWKTGKGGFGAGDVAGAHIRTEWKTPQIWLRRTFRLESTDIHQPAVRVLNDDNVTVFINGREVVQTSRLPEGYEDVATIVPLAGLLRPGENVLAVTCKQTRGDSQYVDVGLVKLVEAK